jgi:hypothetical protein
MARLAEMYYNTTGIFNRVLGAARNNLQMYTEQNLEQLLVNGDIDCGFFYEVERIWDKSSNLRFIELPEHLDFSNVSLNSYYAKVRNEQVRIFVCYSTSYIRTDYILTPRFIVFLAAY